MKQLCICLSVSLVFSALFVYATDVEPPSWRGNGADGQTFQQWEFTEPAPMSNPEIVSNVYGRPFGEVFGGEWTNGLPNPTDPAGPPVSGWWLPTAEHVINFQVPNRPNPLEMKLLRLQITSSKSPQSKSVTGDQFQEGSNTYNMAWQHANTPWYTYVSDWIIMPNPAYETISIQFPPDTLLEEVVVDSWCMPEPCIGALLPFLLLLIPYRKR